MINLLPAKIKKEQKLKQISKQINVAIFTLLIMVAMSYTAVYLVDYYLSSQIDKNNDLLEQTRIQIAKLKPIEDDINTTNAKITKLESLKSQRYDWSTIISDINNSVPANVQLKSYDIDAKSNRVTLNASAETRSDIVKLQASLEKLPYFKNLSFSSSTFSEGTDNYNFNMQGDLEK